MEPFPLTSLNVSKTQEQNNKVNLNHVTTYKASKYINGVI